MRAFAALLLGTVIWAMAPGAAPAAETTFQTGGFTFKTDAPFPAGRHAELVQAFRGALHTCIEYEWASKSIAPVAFTSGDGAPAALADDLETSVRNPDSMKFFPRKPLSKAQIARYYRFVIHFKSNPTWDDGKPIQGLAENSLGVVYVTLDARGEVNGVFYAASWSESLFKDPRDMVKPNLSEAICS